MKREFIACYSFLNEHIPKFLELLNEADSRGVLVEETLELLDVRFWSELIDYPAFPHISPVISSLFQPR